MKKKGLINLEAVIIVALVVNLASVAVATHRSFKEKMSRMTCDSNMRSIMEAIEIYHAYYNIGTRSAEEQRIGEVNVKFLVSKEFLSYVPRCSHGGVYKWDSAGELYCTYHGRGEMD